MLAAATWADADFNSDEKVDDVDQAIFAQQWMMAVEDMKNDDDERDAVFAAVGAGDDMFMLFDE